MACRKRKKNYGYDYGRGESMSERLLKSILSPKVILILAIAIPIFLFGTVALSTFTYYLFWGPEIMGIPAFPVAVVFLLILWFKGR